MAASRGRPAARPARSAATGDDGASATKDVAAWAPMGAVLADYLDGDVDAALSVVLEDGCVELLPASALFRADGMPPAEETALELAHGRVLDAGAGAGAHALALQAAGLGVTGLDVCPQAVEVMRRRGLADARLGDVFSLARAERFDTILFLMNGLGLAGDLDGLRRLLASLHRHLHPSGALLADGGDLRRTDDEDELARLAARRRRGRYFGEATYRLEYKSLRGAPYGWLFIDAETLAELAEPLGWSCQVVFEDLDSSYLARLVSRA
jgi:SAM-dependent methyltransferase